jgi:hypothetical protein
VISNINKIASAAELPDGTVGWFSEFTSVKQTMQYHTVGVDNDYEFVSAILKFTAVGGAFPATGSFFLMLDKTTTIVKAQMLKEVYAPKVSQCMWRAGSAGLADLQNPRKYNCYWLRDQIDTDKWPFVV